ncbi:MAG: hypothetical protein JSV44_09615 [Candidatus Zixiibacteriota bacterium]|nr:MAG: hypothetical protein JSV44_09615 [candidate division Zixibacteria bacterium]
MRLARLLTIIIVLCLFICPRSRAVNVLIRAEASPLLAPGYLELNSDFTVDLYMTQNSGSDICGLSATWEFASPDGPLAITHRDIGGHSAEPSILLLNGFEEGGAYWNAMNALRLDSWDGILPDTFNYTTIAIPLMPPYPCWPSDNLERIHMQVGFTAIEEGTFCIDSIAHSDGTYDWLWSAPADPAFNGPYCWDIVSELPPENQPPELADIGPQTVDEMEILDFTVTANDPDGDIPILWADNMPDNADFTNNGDGTGSFYWQTDNFDAGENDVTFYATDALDTELYDSTIVTITVINVNQAPVIFPLPGQEQNVNEGDTLLFVLNATDPDLTIPLIEVDSPDYELVANMVFVDSLNGVGVLTFAPDYTQGGDPMTLYYLRWRAVDVEDPELITATPTIQFGVINVNLPPELAAIGDTSVTEGETLVLTLSADPVDGDPLIFSVNPVLDNSNLVNHGDNTATFTFSPGYDQAGAYVVTFAVTDGELIDEETITITVIDYNPPPQIAAIAPITVIETETVSFTAFAFDPDGSIPELSAAPLPDNATFDDNSDGTGTFNWPTNESDAGYYEIIITAADEVDPELTVSTTAAITIIDSEATLMVLRPDTHLVMFAQAVNPIQDTIYLGGAEDRPVDEIDPASLLVNGTIPPTSWIILPSYPGFVAKVLRITFPTRDFVLDYGVMFDTTVQTYDLSGEFIDNEPFSLDGQFVMIGHRFGDVNNDAEVNLSDILYLSAYVYQAGAEPRPFRELGDLNQDGDINLLDILLLVKKIYGSNSLGK